VWHIAAMRVAAAAISIECYRMEHGAWPAKLSDLGKDALPDPCTRQELIYKHTDDGVLLYSIGVNARDEGGIEDNKHGKDDVAFRLFDPEKRNTLKHETAWECKVNSSTYPVSPKPQPPQNPPGH